MAPGDLGPKLQTSEFRERATRTVYRPSNDVNPVLVHSLLPTNVGGQQLIIG